MKIVIRGGGISGLTAAYTLQQRGYTDIMIVEKSDRLGGCIQSVEHEGFLFELGPRSLRGSGHGQTTLALARELGLPITCADPSAAKRYTLRNGALRQISLRDPKLLLALLREPFRRKGDGEESIDAFFRRRLGSYVADNLVDPFVSGIFAGDPTQLSLRACFPQLELWEKNNGSLLGGAWANRGAPKHPLFSFPEGMEQLPRALAAQLDVSIKLNSIEVPPADLVVNTLPDRSIPRASVVVVNLGWRTHVLSRSGFGYLVPSNEAADVLGVVFDSCVFPQHNRHVKETRLTVMMGGVRRPDLLELSEEGLLEMALVALSDHLEIRRAPDVFLVTKQRDAIPQYPLGHAMPGNPCRLGSSYHGVGVNDCIHAARSIPRAV